MKCRETQRLIRTRKRTGTCWTCRTTEFPVRPAVHMAPTPGYAPKKKHNAPVVVLLNRLSFPEVVLPVIAICYLSKSVHFSHTKIQRESEVERVEMSDSFIRFRKKVYQYLLTASVFLSSQTKTQYFTEIYMDL